MSLFNLPIRFNRKLLLLFVVILGLSACDRPTNQLDQLLAQHQQQTVKLKRAINSPLVWQLEFIQTNQQQMLMRDLFEGLVVYDPTGKIVAGVAQSWESSDNQNWTFILREKAKWSNGQPVTANDFVQSWQKLATTDHPFKNYLNFINLQNATAVIQGEQPVEQLGVEAIDDRILRVQLDKPTPFLPEMLAHIALLPQWLDNSNTEAGKLISNGAYVIEHTKDKEIQLNRNPHYWDQNNVFFAQVSYHQWQENQGISDFDIIQNPSVALANIRLPTLCTYYYAFNFNHPQLAQSEIRQALVSMISVKNSLPTESAAMMQASTDFLPYSLQMEAKNSWEPILVENLLQQQNITEKQPLKLQLTYEENGIHPSIARALIQMWTQSDLIKISPQTLKWQEVAHKRNQGDYHIIRSGWCADYHEPSSFLMNFHSKSPDNKSGYQNRHVDELLEKTLFSISSSERTALYQQISAILLKDAVVLPIFQYMQPIYVSTTLQGVEQKNPTEVIYSKHLKRHAAKTTNH